MLRYLDLNSNILHIWFGYDCVLHSENGIFSVWLDYFVYVRSFGRWLVRWLSSIQKSSRDMFQLSATKLVICGSDYHIKITEIQAPFWHASCSVAALHSLICSFTRSLFHLFGNSFSLSVAVAVTVSLVFHILNLVCCTFF